VLARRRCVDSSQDVFVVDPYESPLFLPVVGFDFLIGLDCGVGRRFPTVGFNRLVWPVLQDGWLRDLRGEVSGSNLGKFPVVFSCVHVIAETMLSKFLSVIELVGSTVGLFDDVLFLEKQFVTRISRNRLFFLAVHIY